MISINDYKKEAECCYKDETYKVRDNGAVMRMTKGGLHPRPLDNVWTFGIPGRNGYMTINAEFIHRIVATAFIGDAPTPQHIVDHIDTNRQNNRPENLRWLTKLENILLNPITRGKIEFLCGSIENFLRNPSMLKGFEYQDKNFEWMRAVTKEEAENTLRNWMTLLKSPRKYPSTGGIGEWIHKNNYILTNSVSGDNQVDEASEDINSHSLESQFNKNDDQKQTDSLSQQMRKKALMDKANQKKIIKKQVREMLFKMAKSKNWDIRRNVEIDGCKADYMIIHEEKKILLQSLRTTRNIEAYDKIFTNHGYKCFWLGIDDEKWYDNLYPYFQLSIHNDECYVNICGDLWKNLKEFIVLAIEDKLIVKNNILAKSLKIKFREIDCYACGTSHYIYCIDGFYAASNSQLSANGVYFETNEEIDCFNPVVLDSVGRFIASHPELNLPMGEIKNRYSHTRSESYMSFGCPRCDCIVGDFYLNNYIIDLRYEADDNKTFKIDLIEPGLTIPYKHWWMENK